ncbi:MAG: hypothetical protein ACO1NS_11200 [Daejeonella sp.]
MLIELLVSLPFLGLCTILSDVSDALGILTPPILLFWFYYSQKLTLSKNYFDEIDGVYAGFAKPVGPFSQNKGVHAGFIMNIVETNTNGYFKGSFDYGENQYLTQEFTPKYDLVRSGAFTFFGKIDYKMYKDKSRHPYNLNENRTYQGILYIVDRLDFPDEFNIEMYVKMEYRITHFREMQTFKFELIKDSPLNSFELPKSFTLYKRTGVVFEPYENVKIAVFNGTTLVE